MEKVKAIVSVCGDYCAFHEMSLKTDYIFGEHFLCKNDEIADIACEEFDCDFDELKGVDKTRLDAIANEWLDSFEDYDYCDYEKRDIMIDVTAGVITKKYMEI